MSFRCEACKVAQPAGTRPIMKVIATRDRVYNTHGGDIPGKEIALEQRVCPECDGQYTMPAIATALNATPLGA